MNPQAAMILSTYMCAKTFHCLPLLYRRVSHPTRHRQLTILVCKIFLRLWCADPRVRAFAELALKEIRSGMGSDTSLLSDKAAFSEFMDKVNER